MVDASSDKVLADNLLGGKRRLADIVPAIGRVRQGKKRQVFQNIGVYGHSNRIAVRIMNHPVACVCRGHKIDVGDSLGLPVTFIIHEEKCAVLYDRPANRAAKLVPPELRLWL